MYPSLSFDLQMFDSGLLLCFTIGGGHVHASALLPGLVPHAKESTSSKKFISKFPIIQVGDFAVRVLPCDEHFAKWNNLGFILAHHLTFLQDQEEIFSCAWCLQIHGPSFPQTTTLTEMERGRPTAKGCKMKKEEKQCWTFLTLKCSHMVGINQIPWLWKICTF